MKKTVKVKNLNEPLKEKAIKKLEVPGKKLKNIIRRNSPKFKGGLKRSWRLEKTEDGWEIFSEKPQAAATDQGTKPFWPPIQPLKEWAKIKLGSESLGYAVQQKIAQEGIDAQEYIKESIDEFGERYHIER